MVHEYIAFTQKNGYFNHKRNEQAKYWMYESINEHLRLNFYNDALIQKRMQEAEKEVLAGQQTSFVAAQNLLDLYFEQLKNGK